MYAEEQILTREWALTLLFHIAFILKQPVLQSHQQASQSIVGKPLKSMCQICLCVCMCAHVQAAHE